MDIKDIPNDLDDRLLFADSGPRMEREYERARLERAVVEAAKAWATHYTHSDLSERTVTRALVDSVDALLQFEQEHQS